MSYAVIYDSQEEDRIKDMKLASSMKDLTQAMHNEDRSERRRGIKVACNLLYSEKSGLTDAQCAELLDNVLLRLEETEKDIFKDFLPRIVHAVTSPTSRLDKKQKQKIWQALAERFDDNYQEIPGHIAELQPYLMVAMAKIAVMQPSIMTREEKAVYFSYLTDKAKGIYRPSLNDIEFYNTIEKDISDKTQPTSVQAGVAEAIGIMSVDPDLKDATQIDAMLDFMIQVQLRNDWGNNTELEEASLQGACDILRSRQNPNLPASKVTQIFNHVLTRFADCNGKTQDKIQYSFFMFETSQELAPFMDAYFESEQYKSLDQKKRAEVLDKSVIAIHALANRKNFEPFKATSLEISQPLDPRRGLPVKIVPKGDEGNAIVHVGEPWVTECGKFWQGHEFISYKSAAWKWNAFETLARDYQDAVPDSSDAEYLEKYKTFLDVPTAA